MLFDNKVDIFSANANFFDIFLYHLIILVAQNRKKLHSNNRFFRMRATKGKNECKIRFY